MHLVYTPPPPPKKKKTQFLLRGTTVVPRQIKDNCHAKGKIRGGGGGVNKVHYGLSENCA